MFHIVEDIDYLRELVNSYLAHFGYKTMQFCSAEEYIAFVKSGEYDSPIAVFTDISMSGMDGYKMIGLLSRLKPKLKFVVMTGECSVHSKYIGKACMFLSKPFSSKDFLEVVNSLVRCHICSPSDEHGCRKSDHRKKFPINDWQCPHQN